MLKINKGSSDTELWACFKSGDKNAFKILYYKYYMMLYRYGQKTCGDGELTEDSLQDLFLKLWKNRSNLAEVSSVKSYLFRSFTNTLMDAIKANKRKIIVTENYEEEEESIEEIIINNQTTLENNHNLNLALHHLTKRQREVVSLYFFEGLSYKQIAEILPLQYQAIRNCVHEAIKVLRKNMSSKHFEFINIMITLYLYN